MMETAKVEIQRIRRNFEISRVICLPSERKFKGRKPQLAAILRSLRLKSIRSRVIFEFAIFLCSGLIWRRKRSASSIRHGCRSVVVALWEMIDVRFQNGLIKSHQLCNRGLPFKGIWLNDGLLIGGNAFSLLWELNDGNVQSKRGSLLQDNLH